MNLLNFLCDGEGVAAGIKSKVWYTNIVGPVLNIIDIVLFPLIIIAASLGMIYAIKLGVDLARAESADKRSEAKTKMIYFIVAFAITIVLLILLKLFTANAEEIFNWIIGYNGKAE